MADKEGRCSRKVADLEEFWRGQKNICLCDPNILACKDWKELLGQLAASQAYIDFNQGIDVRLATAEKIDFLNKVKIKDHIHLAWDNPKDDLTEDFKRFQKFYKRKRGTMVYVLVNYESCIDDDLYRIYTLKSMNYDPFVMIYDKENANPIYKDLARWVNNKFIFNSCEKFEDYKK